ncbi:MAG: hypothetical protein DRR16_17540 [Candidatus Parabeggiatoa sp. nov. 3]|nr:MAG: hypothetical protein DRR00_19455 [Gammaproteobacteria bacterium]RKZ64261.1 MAG: hypothetical protein DRQ99_15770 [Gammaproteobacteria bacterium]RKZ83336.1 MAG: hypothetical protein DRR16_17540 [Gammaproteobacteria bacterium]
MKSAFTNKRFSLILALTAVLTLGMPGCNDDDDDEATSAVTPSETKLQIGGIYPLTGILAEFGELSQKGAELAIKDLTEAGFQVEMTSKDSGSNPTNSVTAATQLVSENNAQVILTASASETIEVAEKVTIPNQVLQISYAAVSPTVSVLAADDGHDLLFRTNVSGTAQGIVLAKTAIDKGYQKLALLYVDDALGQGTAQVFTENFENWGGQVVAAVKHSTEVQSTYVDELTQAAVDGAEALVVISFPQHIIVFLQEAMAGSFFDKFLFVMAQRSETVINAMGSMLEGVCGTAPAVVFSDSMDKFNVRYQAEYGTLSTQLAGNAYDAVVVSTLAAYAVQAKGETMTAITIRDHLRDVAGAPGERVEPKIDELKRARELLQAGKQINYNGAYTDVDFDEKGDVSAPIDVWCVKDGQMITENTFMPDNFEVVGKAGMFFDGSKDFVRSQESPLGNLVADVMLAGAQASDNTVAASFINAGSLRNSIGEGEITHSELLIVLPFGNTLFVLDITGRELVSALDNGFSQSGSETTGAFLSVAGMQISYCDTTPCAEALLDNGVVTSVTINAEAIELDKTYRVATHDYLAGGGDNFTMLEEACNSGSYCQNTDKLLVDLLTGEFQNNSPVTRNVEGRINQISSP